ncbi:GNAT family N-acetyltransferase [Nocardia sp. NBC_01377]|uniref:GNAT family N-acetyltransferase n=1 Tax=Nocardia sp. NBC_01377 TaxID=2903595 RepID=UPI003250E09F
MDESLGIRLAEAADFDSLQAIFVRASLSNAGDRDVLLANPDALVLTPDRIAQRRTVVAVTDTGTIAGFASSGAITDDSVELDDLFVDPSMMRRGIGRRLVDAIAADARRRGLTEIVVTANPHADAFYRSAGFVELHQVSTEFGSGARMSLAVTRRRPA